MRRRHTFFIVLLISTWVSVTIANSPRIPPNADPMKETLKQNKDAKKQPPLKQIKPLAVPIKEPLRAKPTKGVDLFMREKLKAAKSIVEGLTVEDYELIREGAEKLVVMSHAADWQVVQGPIYIQDSSDFRSAAKQIVEACDDLNLEGALIGYVQVSLSCVRCHKHVRKAKVAQLPEVPGLFQNAVPTSRVARAPNHN